MGCTTQSIIFGIHNLSKINISMRLEDNRTYLSKHVPFNAQIVCNGLFLKVFKIYYFVINA